MSLTTELNLAPNLKEWGHTSSTTSLSIAYLLVRHLMSWGLLSKNFKINIYRIIILPVALYGCGTWSLILRQERRLSVFENRVLRRIFGPKRDEVTREWRELHNEEHSDLYCSHNIVRVI